MFHLDLVATMLAGALSAAAAVLAATWTKGWIAWRAAGPVIPLRVAVRPPRRRRRSGRLG